METQAPTSAANADSVMNAAPTVRVIAMMFLMSISRA